MSFSSNHIARIIRGLDSNKAHGNDMIHIRMLKICGESISKPLEIILNLPSKKFSFLMNGKKQMWFWSIKKVISKNLPTCFITSNMWKNI